MHLHAKLLPLFCAAVGHPLWLQRLHSTMLVLVLVSTLRLSSLSLVSLTPAGLCKVTLLMHSFSVALCKTQCRLITGWVRNIHGCSGGSIMFVSKSRLKTTINSLAPGLWNIITSSTYVSPIDCLLKHNSANALKCCKAWCWFMVAVIGTSGLCLRMQKKLQNQQRTRLTEL